MDVERQSISRLLEWCEGTLVELAELDDPDLLPLLGEVQATALDLRNRLDALDVTDAAGAPASPAGSAPAA